MAIAATSIDKLTPILEAVASEMGRRGVAFGSGGKGQMEIRREANVKRTVQVYWTPFQANIPGELVGLHLNIDKPTKHWVEGYISPTEASWIFCFHERAIDGEYQLAYYTQQKDWRQAVEDLFELTSWYSLVPCDLTWGDVTCSVDPESGWSPELAAVAGGGGPELDKEVKDSLKKSTIVWLRWRDRAGAEHTMPVWFVAQDDKLYVVSGERQQTIPDARHIRKADVIVRWRGHGNSRVAELPATVRVLPPGPEWNAIAEKLAEKRLNVPGAPEDLARRWRDECNILEITP